MGLQGAETGVIKFLLLGLLDSDNFTIVVHISFYILLVLELKVLFTEISSVIYRKYLAALVIPGNGLIEHLKSHGA